MSAIERKRRRSPQSFTDLCHRVGFHLEPFQVKIAGALLGPEREKLVTLPRKNGKVAADRDLRRLAPADDPRRSGCETPTPLRLDRDLHPVDGVGVRVVCEPRGGEVPVFALRGHQVGAAVRQAVAIGSFEGPARRWSGPDSSQSGG